MQENVSNAWVILQYKSCMIRQDNHVRSCMTFYLG